MTAPNLQVVKSFFTLAEEAAAELRQNTLEDRGETPGYRDYIGEALLPARHRSKLLDAAKDPLFKNRLGRLVTRPPFLFNKGEEKEAWSAVQAVIANANSREADPQYQQVGDGGLQQDMRTGAHIVPNSQNHAEVSNFIRQSLGIHLAEAQAYRRAGLVVFPLGAPDSPDRTSQASRQGTALTVEQVRDIYYQRIMIQKKMSFVKLDPGVYKACATSAILGLREIRRVVRHPLMTPSGWLFTGEAHHCKVVPDFTEEQVKTAMESAKALPEARRRTLLFDAFDAPYEFPVGQVNAVASVLTLLLSHIRCPAFTYEADKAGSGKSRLAKEKRLILGITDAERSAASLDQFTKQISAALAQTVSGAVLMDNIRSESDDAKCPIFQHIVTSDASVDVELKYSNGETVWPLWCFLDLTGNRLAWDEETRRRLLQVHIKWLPAAEARDQYRVKDPKGEDDEAYRNQWLKENRLLILGLLMVALEEGATQDHRRPNHTPLRSYTTWDRKVGSAISWLLPEWKEVWGTKIYKVSPVSEAWIALFRHVQEGYESSRGREGLYDPKTIRQAAEDLAVSSEILEPLYPRYLAAMREDRGVRLLPGIPRALRKSFAKHTQHGPHHTQTETSGNARLYGLRFVDDATNPRYQNGEGSQVRSNSAAVQYPNNKDSLIPPSDLFTPVKELQGKRSGHEGLQNFSDERNPADRGLEDPYISPSRTGDLEGGPYPVKTGISKNPSDFTSSNASMGRRGSSFTDGREVRSPSKLPMGRRGGMGRFSNHTHGAAERICLSRPSEGFLKTSHSSLSSHNQFGPWFFFPEAPVTFPILPKDTFPGAVSQLTPFFTATEKARVHSYLKTVLSAAKRCTPVACSSWSNSHGRWCGQGPALQNIHRSLRQHFKPVRPGCVFVDLDWVGCHAMVAGVGFGEGWLVELVKRDGWAELAPVGLAESGQARLYGKCLVLAFLNGATTGRELARRFGVADTAVEAGLVRLRSRLGRLAALQEQVRRWCAGPVGIREVGTMLGRTVQVTEPKDSRKVLSAVWQGIESDALGLAMHGLSLLIRDGLCLVLPIHDGYLCQAPATVAGTLAERAAEAFCGGLGMLLGQRVAATVKVSPTWGPVGEPEEVRVVRNRWGVAKISTWSP